MTGSGIHPFVLIVAATLLAAVACFVLALRVSGPLKRVLLLGLTLILLAPSGLLTVALKPELVDGRYRTFKRLYREVQVGMTRADVEQLVDQHYPPGGVRMEPEILEDSGRRLIYRMNPERSRYPNCEDFILQMRDARVASKSYSPD